MCWIVPRFVSSLPRHQAINYTPQTRPRSEARLGRPARLEIARGLAHPCSSAGAVELYSCAIGLSADCQRIVTETDRGAGCALGMVGDGHTGDRGPGLGRD